MDKLIAEAGTTIDKDKRNAILRRIVQISRDDIAYVPVHFQVLTWAMKKTSTCRCAPTTSRSSNMPSPRAESLLAF